MTGITTASRSNKTNDLVDFLKTSSGEHVRVFNTSSQNNLRGWEYRWSLDAIRSGLRDGTLKYSKEQSKASDGINLTKVKNIQAAGLYKLADSEFLVTANGQIISGNHRGMAIASYEEELPDVEIRVVVLSPSLTKSSQTELANRENRGVTNTQTSVQILNTLDRSTGLYSEVTEQLKKSPHAQKYLRSDLICRTLLCLLENGMDDIDPIDLYQTKPSGYLDVSGALVNVPSAPMKKAENGTKSSTKLTTADLAKVRRLVRRVNEFIDCALSSASSSTDVSIWLRKQGFMQVLVSALLTADLDDSKSDKPARMRRKTGEKLRMADVLQNLARNKNTVDQNLSVYSAKIAEAGPRLKQILLAN